MKKISGDSRRFLNALLISVLFHGVLILAMGFWTLKIPAIPELPPVLSVTITPEVAVMENTAPESIPENRPPETEKKTAETPEPVESPVEKPQRISAEKENRVPVSPVRPVEREKTAPVQDTVISSADNTEESAWALDIDKDSSVPIPTPSGSAVVYDDSEDLPEETSSLPDEAERTEDRTLSEDEIKALASVLDNNTNTGTENQDVSNTIPAEISVSNSSLIPENADLVLDRGNSTRRPKTPLDLDIPGDLLSGIDHDGFVTVEFTLTPEGRIMDPKVIDSSVDDEIGTEVKKALRSWAFTGADEGNVKNITGKITIRFKVR